MIWIYGVDDDLNVNIAVMRNDDNIGLPDDISFAISYVYFDDH